MRRAWKTSRLMHIVFATAISLFLFGCGGDDAAEVTTATATGGTGGGGSEGSTGAKEPPQLLPDLVTKAEPAIKFLYPTAGTNIPAGNELSVEVSVTYFKLEEPSSVNEEGVGHFGVYLDNLSDSYLFKSYGVNNAALIPMIPEGEHTLTAVLLNNDGTPVEGAKSDTVTINVTAMTVDQGPFLQLMEPEDQTLVTPGETLTVRVDIKNVELVEPDAEAPPAAGDGTGNVQGHYRVYLGYDENDDYLAATTGSEVDVTLPESLVPGQHQLRVELWDANGNLVESPSPEYGQSITLIVPGLKKPELEVVSPVEGDLLVPGSTLTFDLNINKLELVAPGGLPGGEVDVADGHVRVYLDDDTGDDYLLAEASKAPVLEVPDDLSAGPHTLTVMLVDTDGVPLGASTSLEMVSPGFDVITPDSNSWLEYEKDNPVEVAVSYFELLEPGEDTVPEVGKGHYRVYLDDADGENYLVATAEPTATITVGPEVGAGQHSLRFSLREKNGSPVGLDRVVDVFVGAGPPSLAVQAPYAGQAVHPGTSVVFSFGVENFSLTPYAPDTPNVYGQGHYRIYIDNNTGDSYALASHLPSALVPLSENLTLGPHTFTVALFNNDGTPLGVETEVWLDVVAPTTPVVQVLSPAGGTAFAAGSVIEIESEVFGLDLVPESGINQPGKGHIMIRDKESGDLLFNGESNPSTVELPATWEPGLKELEVQLVTNTGSALPNAKASVWVESWEAPTVNVVTPVDVPELVLGEELPVEIAVLGVDLIGEEGAENAVGEGNYTISLGDEILASGADLAPVLTVPEDLDGGTHTVTIQLNNNDGTEIIGASTSFDFTLNLPVVDVVFPDGQTQVYVADGLMYLELGISFFDLIPPAPGLLDTLGQGHYLLYLDGATGADFFFEGSDLYYTLPLPAGLEPGIHTLKVVLVDNVNTIVGVQAEQNFEIGVHGLAVIAPEKNAEWMVGEPMSMDILVENFQLAPIEAEATNVEGVGHYAIYLNDEEDALLTDSNPSPLLTLENDVPAGEHVLRIELLNNDGTPVGVEVTLPIVVVEL